MNWWRRAAGCAIIGHRGRVSYDIHSMIEDAERRSFRSEVRLKD